jgi:hypothetical protein
MSWLSPRRPWLFIIVATALVAAATPILAKVSGMSAVESLKTLAATVGIVSFLVAWTLSGKEGEVGRLRGMQFWSNVQAGEHNEPPPAVWEILCLVGYAVVLFAVVVLLPS